MSSKGVGETKIISYTTLNPVSKNRKCFKNYRQYNVKIVSGFCIKQPSKNTAYRSWRLLVKHFFEEYLK